MENLMKNGQSTIISIDCGTQSLRVIIFAEEGSLLAKKQIMYKPCVSPRPGWAEQDPAVWWGALCTGVAALKSSHPDLIARAKGIGITAQRDTVILIGKDGNVLRPAITWLDTRKAHGRYHPNFIMKAALKAVDYYEKIMHSQSDGQCNWIQENEPEIWKKTWRVLMVSG